MLRKFLLYLFWLIISAGILNAQSNTAYKEVDDLVKSFPLKPSSPADIRTLARELKLQLHSDDELARAAFVWITNNISYDCDGCRQKKGLYELSDVLSQHKGICSGYASLMKFFCDELGVECVVINGFATGIGVTSVHADSLKTNHAWNAVKINGEWKLVDPTWGSGGANEDCTQLYPQFNDYYFYCKPEQLIITHFPDSVQWQLMKTPYTKQQFADSVKNWKKISEPEVEIKDSVIRKKLGETVRFHFNMRDTMNTVSISTYGKEDITIFDSIVATDSGYYYDYKITEDGKYRIDVSLFFDRHKEDETYEGTPVQTYLMQVEPRKKTKSPVSPKKTIKK